jgi:predicted AlkP superfamily phosphohydrolase/phosphomutase
LGDRRVLIIGIDGATLDLIRPWADQDMLPTFDLLMKEGSWGPLRSTLPPLTGPAWVTSFTGGSPGKHNIYDFFTFAEGTYDRRPVNSTDIKAELIWERLNRAGMRAGILNAPLAYPVQPMDGFLISGLLTPERADDHIWPPSLKTELDEKVPGYRFTEDFRLIVAGQEEALLNELFEVTEKTAAVARHLISQGDWNLFFVLFDGMDRILHFFWKYMDPSHPRHEGDSVGERLSQAVLSYHQYIDRVVADLADAAGPETDLVILSDHGFGPLYRDVHITRWLIERGWMVQEQPDLLHRLSGVALNKALAQVSRLKEGMVRIPWLRSRMRLPKRLKQHLPPPFAMPVQPCWEATRAFLPSSSGRAIRVNLKGREPKGTVNPGTEYDDLVTEIIAGLYELRDPDTGERIVETAYRKEEAFRGDYLENAPDILVELKGTYFLQEGLGDSLIQPSRLGKSDKSGVHRPEGILFLKGPAVRKGYRVQDASIQDVAPTVQHLLDGRVLEDAFQTAHREENPVRFEEDSKTAEAKSPYRFTEEETKEIERRLKGLHYI